MNSEIIKRNRELYIQEFKATGRLCTEKIISYLDSHHFFESRCNGHDHEPGGTANHSLWTLKFARETRESILKKNPEKNIPDDELVFTCLLHDVCDCNPSHSEHGARSKEIMKNRIKGFSFPLDVLNAVNAHMHSKLFDKYTSSNSNSKGELLHYLVHNSDQRAIEYAGGIPFGTEPKRIIYKYIDDTTTFHVRFDSQKHIYWWDTSEGACNWTQEVDLSNMPSIPARRKAHLYIREYPLEADFTVMANNQGNLALFVVRRFSGFGCATLMGSDRAGFDYKQFIVYVSRYPKYRSSYIVGCKSNGKWGIISAKDQIKDNNGFPIGITLQANYEFDSPDDAINALRGNTGHHIRIRHSRFYKKIVIPKPDTGTTSDFDSEL